LTVSRSIFTRARANCNNIDDPMLASSILHCIVLRCVASRLFVQRNMVGLDVPLHVLSATAFLEVRLLTPPLNHICNTSFLSGAIPQRLKCPVVKPLFKKGDRTDVTNYRPISIPIHTDHFHKNPRKSNI
jgi:hypothetical protein